MLSAAEKNMVLILDWIRTDGGGFVTYDQITSLDRPPIPVYSMGPSEFVRLLGELVQRNVVVKTGRGAGRWILRRGMLQE